MKTPPAARMTSFFAENTKVSLFDRFRTLTPVATSDESLVVVLLSKRISLTWCMGRSLRLLREDTLS